MNTHYDLLGVQSTASVDEIRASYRVLARRMHPDAQTGSAAGGSGGWDMAAINEAWHVLSDPGRRAMYDASLRVSSVAPAGGRRSEPTVPVVFQRASSGRFPKWPFVMLFVLAAIFIFTAGALYEPSAPAKPDNLLFAGSCVTLLPDRDAVEVGCETPHDAVVVTVVNFDAACPMETETFRDHQGRGYACVTKVP
ncbi:MAG: DnaJ domain-containing protein [Actinomycetota bacterium]